MSSKHESASETRDKEKKRMAKERAKLYAAIASGDTEEGLTEELSKISGLTERELKEKAKARGSKTVRHAADVVKAQRLIIEEKDLADRFLRISNKMKELEGRDEASLEQYKKEIDALRSLLRLSVRSQGFRNTILEMLRVTKHVIEENAEGSVDDVVEEGQAAGVSGALEQVQRTIKATRKNVDSSEKVISDEDWEKLTDQMDHFFSELNSHSEFRKGIKQLFTLGESISERVSKTSDDPAVDALQEEAWELVAQFSGDEALDRLIRRIRRFTSSLRGHEDAQKWWKSFREHLLDVAETYRGKEDLEEFRKHVEDGRKIFDQYRRKISKIIDSMKLVVDNVTDDKCVSRLRESLATLSDDLYWRDQDGNSYFDKESAGLLASSIGSVISEQFKYLALPKVEHQDSSQAYKLDNLVLSAQLPEEIQFHLETNLSINIRSVMKEESAMSTNIDLTAEVKHIVAEAKDIEFSYNGTLSESGVMDVSILSSDLAIDFVMRPFKSQERKSSKSKKGKRRAKGPRYEFSRLKSRFTISNMQISFHTDTLKHNVLVPMLTNLFKARIIDKLESAIEEALDDALQSLGQQVVSILNQSSDPLSISSIGDVMDLFGQE